MKQRLYWLSVVVAILAAGGLLAALVFSSHSGDPAACKEAMRQQFLTAYNTPQGQSKGTFSAPAECKGIDSKTLDRFAGEIVMEQLQKEVGK